MTTPLLDPVEHLLGVATLNIFAGSSGAGKSGLIASMIRAILDEQPWMGYTTHRPPAIVYIVMDRPWVDTQYWFDQYGIADSDVYHFARLDEPTFLSLEEICKATPWQFKTFFARILNKWTLPPGTLVFLEPLALLTGTDQNHYVRMAVGVGGLYEVVNEPGRRYCLLCTDHPAKQLADAKQRYLRLIDRIGGSAAKGAHANTLMYLAEPGEIADETHHTLQVRPRRSELQSFPLEKDHATGKLTRVGTAVTTPVALSNADQLVLGIVPEPPGSLSRGDLVTVLIPRISEATLDRSLGTLLEHGFVHRPAGRGTYQRTLGAKVLQD